MIDFRTVDEWHIGNDEVVKAYLNGTLVWDKDFKKVPFYVENITDSNETLSIKRHTNAPAITIEMSTDCIAWTTLGTTNTAALTYTLTPGSRLYLRANTTAWGGSVNGVKVYNVINGVSRIGGNIMSLLYGSGFTGGETSFPAGSVNTFSELFSENTYISSDYNLQDASGLLLPPVTTQRCYQDMFQGCRLLTLAPALPAVTLADYCYVQLFSGCRLLNKIVCLATSRGNSSTYGWVSNVASTGTFIKATGVTWYITTDYSGRPDGWTVIDA